MERLENSQDLIKTISIHDLFSKDSGIMEFVEWKNKNLPKNVHVTLSDQSQGMVKDARNYVGEGKGQISYQMIDCRQIPKEDHSFDKVIANHVLFYQ